MKAAFAQGCFPTLRVCVCVYVRVYVCVCVRARVRVCVRALFLAFMPSSVRETSLFENSEK